VSEASDADPRGMEGAAVGGILPSQLEGVYDRRFNRSDSARKDGVWTPIVEYLQRFISPQGCVLDIACDRGSFIRHIHARERWASDIRDMTEWLPPDVHFVQSSGLTLDQALPTDHFDLVFMSNYLEHLLSRSEVVRQLEVAHSLLRSGGRLVVLQPNIRLVGGSYWDFIDHHVALTERSLSEAALLAGFRTERLTTRFLPYSTLGRLPQHPALVRLYLKLPPAWWLLGKQTLYVGIA
jgi:SAM-dependent methyltransferase